MIVCVAANPSIDRLFEVERLRAGEIHRPSGLVLVPGGKGLNVARAAASMGAEVVAAAILRGHAGRWVAESLAAEGVRGRFVWTHGETRTSLSVADLETGGLTEFYEHGTEVPSATWPEFQHGISILLPGASWVTISGSMPSGSPDDGYRSLAREVRGAGARVAVDAAGEALALALEAGPDVVKVNAHEAGDLLGRIVATADDALAAAAELRDRAGGPGHAGLVTRGAEGVAIVGPDGVERHGRLYVRGRYPVGSGDAFLAGLVVGLERDRTWPDALRLALGAATANAELPGAGRLDRSRAEALAERTEVREAR